MLPSKATSRCNWSNESAELPEMGPIWPHLFSFALALLPEIAIIVAIVTRGDKNYGNLFCKTRQD